MSSRHPDSLLIVIEGIDGAGKTTLANSLRTWLLDGGRSVTISKEPTTGPWGMKLRESAATGRLTPQDELDYLVKDREQHVSELISPALDCGEIVILDRYYPSTVAYQGAAGIPLNTVLDAHGFAPQPDVLLLLDVEPRVGIERIRARGDKPNAFETYDNLEACRAIFLDLEMPKVVINAAQSPEQVCAEAQFAILKELAERGDPLKSDTERVRDLIAVMPRLTA
ncbi:dTMP kinase [Luteimonas chenhongjianii]|uniref:Thymidylate kinase n=1 Tax=Luteimonas chenhongjianii TaxID=2006110 RepID=A0A290XH05_9GAMM|nr:dTMP kinase [Luteimonas chenhongjianii]ATD68425.1 dTMP kinase [Luteimonas chenhongjianii]